MLGVTTTLVAVVVGLDGASPRAGAATSPAWSVAAGVVPPGPPTSDLYAIACPTSTTCLALGRLAYSGPIVGARSNGRSWSFVPAQTPKAGGAALRKMSCTTTTSCFAVGAFGGYYPSPLLPLMERWNGTRWSIVAAPKPSSAQQARLTGVSCRGPKFCMAVGSYGTTKTGFVDTPFSARWDGRRWSIVATAVPKGEPYHTITTVSCTSATFCFAVGKHDTTFDGIKTLTERWNGTKWSIVPSPSPAEIAHTSNDTKLIDVSCTSTAFCFAVGYYLVHDDLGLYTRPYASRWNGTKWSRLSIALPAGQGEAEAYSVSCVNSASCVTVGYSATATSYESWVTKWNGTSWDTVTNTVPGDTNGLNAVSCAKPTACVAVGEFIVLLSSDPLMLATRFDGSSWSIDPPPKGGSQSRLSQVSCPSASFCLAVGQVTNHETSALSELWDGTSWSKVDVANPTGALRTSLRAISCASSTSCVALGDYTVSSGSSIATSALAERWDGKAWSVIAAPDTFAGSVSCPSSTVCMAVGGTAWQWDGASWMLSDTPPAGSLTAVSCATASSCMAVGSDGHALFSRVWDGTSWSSIAVPKPTGAYPALSAVSCSAADACTAVGNTTASSTKDGTIVERWNGSTWSISSKPAVAGADLESVSCASAAACVAVGLVKGKTLIEQWNGSAWSIATSPNRAGSRFDLLSGLSCPASTSCFAAGWAASDRFSFPLLERLS